MKTLRQTYKIHAPLNKVWDALINPATIEKWGGGAAKMDGVEGSQFSLWNGDIHGTNTHVVPPSRLEQDWFSEGWDTPSKVVFELSEKGGVTTVVLIHENIPDKELDNIDDGWKSFYLGPIKKLLESE